VKRYETFVPNQLSAQKSAQPHWPTTFKRSFLLLTTHPSSVILIVGATLSGHQYTALSRLHSRPLGSRVDKMVLDPISALSLAANVVQFVDFSSKVVSKGCRIYISADGALPNNLELEVVTNDLSRLAKGLKDSELNTVTVSEEEKSLQTMSDECSKIAEELLRRLENLKVKGNSKQRGWKSLRQALKSEWSKEELDGLSERLSIFRDQLQFHILVSMK